MIYQWDSQTKTKASCHKDFALKVSKLSLWECTLKDFNAIKQTMVRNAKHILAEGPFQNLVTKVHAFNISQKVKLMPFDFYPILTLSHFLKLKNEGLRSTHDRPRPRPRPIFLHLQASIRRPYKLLVQGSYFLIAAGCLQLQGTVTPLCLFIMAMFWWLHEHRTKGQVVAIMCMTWGQKRLA